MTYSKSISRRTYYILEFLLRRSEHYLHNTCVPDFSKAQYIALILNQVDDNSFPKIDKLLTF